MMTNKELIAKAIDIAKNYKTLYVMGCFGAPLNEKNKDRYCRNHKYNRNTERTVMIKSATPDTFGFDCVCLIKAILWGWCGNKSANYGGSVYESNGVPDIGADAMIKKCVGVSTDFGNIIPGEVVWKQGHIGIYIGDGLAVESSPAWDNCVQITAVGNIGKKQGYNTRSWTNHGKLPYITYVQQEEVKEEQKGEITVNIELTVLKKGSKGEQVKAVQRMLYAMGYDLGASKVDGSFGGKTDEAIRAYQKKKGLAVDGSVGTKTWTKLLKG